MKTGGKWMKLSACFTALFLVLALVLTALPLTFAPAMAGTIAGESFEDNFDGKGIDADKWVTSGDGVGQNVLAGSLKMKDMPAQSSVITKTPSVQTAKISSCSSTFWITPGRAVL